MNRFQLAEWCTSLKGVIARISGNFSNFFEKVGCCGEVRLDFPTNEVSYQVDSKYVYKM